MLVDHDLHVHTTLSACCSDPHATVPAILDRASACGLRLIGFADHVWDFRCPGASPWYAPQVAERALALRESAPPQQEVRTLFGCESEFRGAGSVGITSETAAQFDFVLLPMSHTHMQGFVLPSGVTSSADIASLMVQRFLELIDTGIASGLAHPFLPCGQTDRVDEIIAAIPASEFRRCFDRAAAAGVSIEITTGFFPAMRGTESDGFHDATFLEVLGFAKSSGCTFHFASDAHTLAGIGSVLGLQPYVDTLGLTRAHLSPLVQA